MENLSLSMLRVEPNLMSSCRSSWSLWSSVRHGSVAGRPSCPIRTWGYRGLYSFFLLLCCVWTPWWWRWKWWCYLCIFRAQWQRWRLWRDNRHSLKRLWRLKLSSWIRWRNWPRRWSSRTTMTPRTLGAKAEPSPLGGAAVIPVMYRLRVVIMYHYHCLCVPIGQCAEMKT